MEHHWKWVKDWYGNPDIPNGTVDCSHWACVKCGKEAEEMRLLKLKLQTRIIDTNDP